MMIKKILLKVNKLFKLPIHPFNLANEGKMNYSQWQFEKGADTIKFYTQVKTTDEMFKDKVVLDIGCGAAGKSIYYASLGAKHVHGVDIVEHYKEDSKKIAEEKGYADKFTFHLCDASKLSFEDNTFDTVIMNDSMEHVSNPKEVLNEIHRVLKKGGKLYVNFCPYFHPYGAHLSDVIGIPWVHMFFTEKTLIAGYKDLIEDKPDKEMRIKFRFSTNEKGEETNSYINKMTIKKFRKILKESNFTITEHYKEVPLRNFFTPLAKLPLIKECFVKMVVVILEK